MDRPLVTISDWRALLAGLGVGADQSAAARGTDLLDRYGREDRRYHSLGHLTAVLTVVDELAELADKPDLVRLAAWFHDAIHQPDGPGGDEERSADLARTELAALGLDEEAVAEVARLVLLTTTHDSGPDDRNGAVLCDADLWILGSSEET
ncbi:MAG: HD domain-containing protein, partial [Acidimicrobiales bacterium]